MDRAAKVGDLVDIYIKGVRVTQVGLPASGYGSAAYIAVPAANGSGETRTLIRPDSPAVTLTVVEPAKAAEWPPRAGDLWRDRDGDLWFGIDIRNYDDPSTPLVELVGRGGGTSVHPADLHRMFGPLALVRREQDGQ